MKIKELIEQLKRLPEDLVVYNTSWDDFEFEVEYGIFIRDFTKKPIYVYLTDMTDDEIKIYFKELNLNDIA